MRALTCSEMSFIAGGHDPDNPPKDIKVPQIIIEGQRPRSSYDSLMWSLLLTRENYTAPDDNDPNHQEHCFINNADQLLDSAPSGVDIEDMRQGALMIQDYVKGQDQSIEYAAVLIADQSGNIRVGPVTSGTPTSVPIASDAGPGERVVGIVHSHPQLSNTTDHSLPSTYASNGPNSQNDERMAAELIASGIMDAKGLLYIIDNATGQMYEYDPQEIRKENRNNVTDDLAQHGQDCNY